MSHAVHSALVSLPEYALIVSFFWIVLQRPRRGVLSSKVGTSHPNAIADIHQWIFSCHLIVLDTLQRAIPS